MADWLKILIPSALGLATTIAAAFSQRGGGLVAHSRSVGGRERSERMLR
jgi:hypothetical protein